MSIVLLFWSRPSEVAAVAFLRWMKGGLSFGVLNKSRWFRGQEKALTLR
jgi:hypothetical protein